MQSGNLISNKKLQRQIPYFWKVYDLFQFPPPQRGPLLKRVGSPVISVLWALPVGHSDSGKWMPTSAAPRAVGRAMVVPRSQKTVSRNQFLSFIACISTEAARLFFQQELIK